VFAPTVGREETNNARITYERKRSTDRPIG